jgi:hypothetical protein
LELPHLLRPLRYLRLLLSPLGFQLLDGRLLLLDGCLLPQNHLNEFSPIQFFGFLSGHRD